MSASPTIPVLNHVERHRRGAILSQNLRLLGMRQIELVNAWDHHGYHVPEQTIDASRHLYQSPHGQVAQLTCQIIGLPSAQLLLWLAQPENPTPWELIRANTIPLHQVTMYSNAYKKVVRPYFLQRKKQQLPHGERHPISTFWLQHNLISKFECGKNSFAPSTHLRWNVTMVTILLRQLGLSAKTEVAELEKLIRSNHLA